MATKTGSGGLGDFLCFALEFFDDLEVWLIIGAVILVVWLAHELFQRCFSNEASRS